MKDDPHIIECKFDSVCAETGITIKKGELALYYPTSKKVYSRDSKAMYEYKCWLADCQMGNEY
jgi:hypothetical protein